MRKEFTLVLIMALGIGLFIAGCKKKPPKPTNLPAQVKVKLPSGEVVTAYKMTKLTQVPPTGTRLIISGKISREQGDLGSVQLILTADSGTKYVLMNPPFMARLEKDGLGKTAKLKGVVISKTSFKNYPAIYIEDILKLE